jgi:hypothetical protein
MARVWRGVVAGAVGFGILAAVPIGARAQGLLNQPVQTGIATDDAVR